MHEPGGVSLRVLLILGGPDMPKIKIETGLDLYYEEHGAGDPLLLMMGTGADRRFWSAQVPASKSITRPPSRPRGSCPPPSLLS